MSHLLWNCYWGNEVERFRRLLAPAGPNNTSVASKSPAIGSNGGGLGASPSGPATSPRNSKPRRTTLYTPAHGKPRDGAVFIGRNEVNSRDHAGLTLLLRAASSPNSNARQFVQALLDHPSIDIYAQDPESGWNALHRSLYAGNVSIARDLLAKERGDLTNHAQSVSKVGRLIKTKDHEGYSPFDVYNSTIASRPLKRTEEHGHSNDGTESVSSDEEFAHGSNAHSAHVVTGSTHGGELYVFGSNKNLSLGVGDEDDRLAPVRVLLQRPSQLLDRFHQTHLEDRGVESSLSLNKIPTLVSNRPLVIQDVAMSKLHTAVLTTDPVSNLYMCGVGRFGRLGLGDEHTQFKFVPVQGPFADRKVHQVALGQNHSMAVAGNGELWTWGSNSDSQLGYILPPPVRSDGEPMSPTPRQVFGSLKKEVVLGVAASAVHSVAFTSSSLFCWGRNLGQLALMDADSRTLIVQQTPRRVGASLLSAPIQMVSAIDKATTCLLANFTVWVFTNYGYNLIKFPVPDVFVNHNLEHPVPNVVANHNIPAMSFWNRHYPGRKDIRYITSGDETIAAVTARGDLFTMQLNHKVEASQPSGSTTNPVKIKGAVTQPKCIWDSRNDGVTSVSIGEHGSVAISTESGAVWKRVKRIKGKGTNFSGSSDSKKKDFKFERVSYIHGCVNVRSSTFGAFAAVRRDISLMSEEINIAGKSLWSDIGSLSCLRDFTAAEPHGDKEASRKPKLWHTAITKERPGSVPHEILKTSDLETDLAQWLRANSLQFDGFDMDIRTSTSPGIMIPVHGWILAGRSSVLREAFSEYRRRGTVSHSDIFLLEKANGKLVLTLPGVDILTVLNIVVYAYEDLIIPAWKYTREAPSDAYRFRQVRAELMRVATGLNMAKLETAARLQAAIEPSLNVDLKAAISDAGFLHDGDVLIQLDGEDVSAHSQLLCQRCPFFEGMFFGRSQGKWLASRRDAMNDQAKVRIDLRHMRPETFGYVLKYLYTDASEELFHEVSSASIDDFSELILDVMGAANELMLDRLSQICQSLIGKFVTTRNIAHLLNEISACSVSEFKDVGLEYICLQLECMLENHLLDGLDDDLFRELDKVVGENQLANSPFARSGRAEALLHDKYPDLAADIEEERRRRIKEMAFKLTQREEERKLSSSYKARVGSLDESLGGAQTPDRTQRRLKTGRNEPFSPSLRPKASHGDMIFNMDDDVARFSSPTSPSPVPRQHDQDLDVESMPPLPEGWQGARSTSAGNSIKPTPSSLSPVGDPAPTVAEANDVAPLQVGTQLRKAGGPWASPVIATSKLDLTDIMSQDSSRSALTAGLAAQANSSASAGKPQTKMSQKERKKQLQLQAEMELAIQNDKGKSVPWEKVATSSRPPPWQTAAAAPRTSLKDAMAEMARACPVRAKPLVSSDAGPTRRRTASPDTRFAGQGRAGSSPAATLPCSKQAQKSRIAPHSKSYMTQAPKAEPSLGASMADIIGQQKRERELVREAVAKRSLQEIQQEQAFQEWWDQESKRAQEEETRRQSKNSEKVTFGSGRGRRGRGGKGKGPETPMGGERSGEGATNARGSREARGGGRASRT